MRRLAIPIVVAGVALAAGPAAAADAQQMEQNKKVVLDFYEKALNASSSACSPTGTT